VRLAILVVAGHAIDEVLVGLTVDAGAGEGPPDAVERGSSCAVARDTLAFGSAFASLLV